jgi:hypothetical protein
MKLHSKEESKELSAQADPHSNYKNGGVQDDSLFIHLQRTNGIFWTTFSRNSVTFGTELQYYRLPASYSNLSAFRKSYYLAMHAGGARGSKQKMKKVKLRNTF